MQSNSAYTVLVVEDNEDLRHILCQRMRERVEEVLEAGDGIVALRMIHDRRIDLVLSDIRMPRMTGLELLAQVRSEGRMLPFIFLSLSENQSELARAKSLGATEFVAKPCKSERLFRAVDAALGVSVELE